MIPTGTGFIFWPRPAPLAHHFSNWPIENLLVGSMSHYFFKQLARIYIIYCGCGPTQSGNDPFALFSKMNPAGTTVAVHPEAAVRLHTISGAKLPISYPFPYKCQQQCTSYALTMPTCLRLIEMQLCVFVHLFPFLSITSNNNRCWHGSRLTIRDAKLKSKTGRLKADAQTAETFNFPVLLVNKVWLLL